ncbi:MAG: deoxynucleoside kinase [Candidatus Falkowbacteria bacterium]|nr:deoxynucleoside kinase [Candidatus Falkowbacteria bacterium]
MSKGFLIVIDGTDGSGKKTQTELLYNWLKENNHPVEKISFPSYGTPSAYFVERYLNGDYGQKANEVNPRLSSIFYALDRFDKSQAIKEMLAEGKIVVTDRYVTANMGHQGSKFTDQAALREYFTWLYDFEYEICQIPKPDLNILLHVSSEINTKLITNRGNVQDIHEKDPEHLKKAELTYLEIAKLFSEDMTMIECVKDDQIMSREEIHEIIKAKVSTLIK